MEVVKSEIYIYDSFFNILGAGGGTTPHRHLNELDKDISLNLGKQKYSLQYYLSVGDQNCSEPGILKLYDPSEDILPCEGMIVIIPAYRRHSAVYGGEKDRVMIGINFYSLWLYHEYRYPIGRVSQSAISRRSLSTIGDFSAMGVYNQFVYVSPKNNMVVVKLSTNRIYGTSEFETTFNLVDPDNLILKLSSYQELTGD